MADLSGLLGAMAIVGIFAIIFAIGVYIVEGIFLSKLNKLMYGKGTPLAWIPICNTYLLGKLTINKIVGWILVGCVALTANYTITINGVETTKSLLPASIVSIISPIYSLATFGLLIYAIIKYFDLKKKTNTQDFGLNNQNVLANSVKSNFQNPNINNSAMDPQPVINNMQQNSFEPSNQNINNLPQQVNPQPIEQNSVFDNIPTNPVGSSVQNTIQSSNSQVEPTINTQNSQNINQDSIFNSAPNIVNEPNNQISQDSIFNSDPTMSQENSENNNFINQG